MDQQERQAGRSLVVTTEADQRDDAMRVAKALSSIHRLRILDYLNEHIANVSEIAEALDLPLATTALHLNGLEEAGLVHSYTAPARRGQQRIYARVYDLVVFHLPAGGQDHLRDGFTTHMPVGAFVNHKVKPTCGLAGAEAVIGILDDPISFYEPARFNAQLVWFKEGFLEYRFPNRVFGGHVPSQLQISLEICSEAPNSDPQWPSDIYVEINQVRVGTWTSPGDFADRRGVFTPAWWPEGNSQYGLLKLWRVNEQGAFVDGQQISAVTINDLHLPENPFILVRIGVEAQAGHAGGINIFGRNFGNYAQDIILEVDA